MPSRVLQEVPVPASTTTAPPQSEQQPHQQEVMIAATNTTTTTNTSKVQPVLKLSFGGVDFSLLPKTSRDGSVTFEAMGDNKAVLSLKNFTGRLQVTCGDAARTQNLVEDAASPSPEKHPQQLSEKSGKTMTNTRRSPTQPQISSWAQSQKATSSPAAAAASKRNPSQAPTPTVANGKKRSTTVEQLISANRSSPLPYHSPLKRSRRSSKSPERTTPLSQQIPHSPITLAQKSQPSSIDCSQTIDSQATTSGSSSTATASKEEQDQEMQNAEQQQLEEEKPKDTTVQDIMNRVEQPSSDSEDEDDDEETEDKSVATNKANDIQEMDEDSEEEDEDETQLPQDYASSPQKSSTTHENNNNATQPSPANEAVTKAIADSKKPMYMAPCPRWGHTMTLVSNNRALVYGGQTFDPENGDPITLADVHVYDVEKAKWFQPVHCESSKKWPRQWHSATYLPERQLLICFGGEVTNSKTGKTTCSDKNNIMVLDTEIMLWYPPSCSGDVPSGRSGHSATLLPSSSNNQVVIFGGVKGNKWLSSVSVLDTTRWIWETPKKISGVAPKARSYHSAIAVQALVNDDFEEDDIENPDATSVKIRSRIVIFGGNDAKQSFNSVHVLEKTEGTTTSWRWIHPTVTGSSFPKPRTGHSAVLLEDGKTICIYGGWDPSEDEDDIENKSPTEEGDHIFQDCYLLDTEKWTWKSGPKPVFAGSAMDSSSGEDCGAQRTGHASVLNPCNKSMNEVMVFGGQIPGARLAGDFQTLSMP